MNKKGIQSNTKIEPCGSNMIIIPDLEQAAEQYRPHGWTTKELAILTKYYNRVPVLLLMKHLPGKTKSAIQGKAVVLGLTRRKE